MTLLLNFLKYLLIILLIIYTFFLGAMIFTPKPPLLENIKFSQAVFDNQRHLLYLSLTPDQQYRLYTPLSQIPKNLIHATLLQEDQYYYFHPAVNPISIIKALVETYILHQRKIGASTITMQVARMVYHIHSRNIPGKLTQIFRAFQLEHYYSKNQILEAYLNLAPYGGNIEGVGSASLVYFQKPIDTLNFSELLTLAVIPQNPLKRSPGLSEHQQLFHARYDLFLRWLKKYPGYKNQKTLMNLPLQLDTLHQMPFEAPHFVVNVLAQYPHQNMLNTTLDLHLQNIITQIAKTYSETNHLNNYAVLLVDTRTMGVKSLIGSANFFDPHIKGQINGTDAKRSPGSALKPFIYALALQQGLIHPFSILKDAPSQFGLYTPEDFDRDYVGPVNATKALVTSRNIPAVALMQQLQHPGFYELLQQADITLLKPESKYGLSLALGGEDVTMQEMVKLYAMLVNNGYIKPLRFLQNSPHIQGTRLLTPEACFLVLDMLKSNSRPNVMSTAAKLSALPIYWKTGTSSHYRDAWTVGIFGPYVLAVWAGDFENKTHVQFVGLESAAPLFFSIIDAVQAQENPPIQDIVEIQNTSHKLNLVRVKICEASGLLPTPACPKTIETWFIPGVSPIKQDNVFREILIDTHTGLRACQVSPTTKFVVYEFWPSDLESLFQKAGIHHAVPPPYDTNCHLDNQTGQEGPAPKIVSPRENLVYSLHLNSPENSLIPLIAITDDDVKTIYWFINQSFIGQSIPNHALDWPAKPGNYTLRAVDDHGRSAVMSLKVALVK